MKIFGWDTSNQSRQPTKAAVVAKQFVHVMGDAKDHQYRNRPWPVIENGLFDRYRVVGEIDFLNFEYDAVGIYQHIASLRRDHYDPDEKIIVYHYDTDYYGATHYGIMLYNFLQTVRSLDISPSVFIMLTSHYGIKQEIEKYYLTHYHNFDIKNDHMLIFESSYQMFQSPPKADPVDISVEKISHAYMCLCGRQRVHRVLFLSALKDLGVLDQGLCSWHFYKGYKLVHWFNRRINSIGYHNGKLKHGAPKHHLLEINPKTFINEDWPINDYFKNIFNRHHETFVGQKFIHPLIKGDADEHRFNLPTISNSFLYVSTESAFLNPYPYITEKTFKPILMKRPFVLVASVGSLAKLRELGFRTFGDYWNEDYDDIADPNVRIQKVLNIVQKICTLSVAELQQLCYNMSDILEYNFDHYVNHYAGSLLETRLKELFP